MNEELVAKLNELIAEQKRTNELLEALLALAQCAAPNSARTASVLCTVP
jgi:hypothetical protein